MALAPFYVTVDADLIDGPSVESAVITVTPNAKALRDPDANKILLAKLPNTNGASALEASLTLWTDVTTGTSASIFYTVTVRAQGAEPYTVTFAALAAGTTTSLADIPNQEAALPLPEALVARDQTLAARDTAVSAAASVQREQASGVAGLTSAGKIYEIRIPDRLADTALEAKYARGSDVITPAGNALQVAMQSSLPAVVIVQGDSTGNDVNDEWVGRITSKLAAAYPDHRVLHRLWNMTTLSYGTPTVIQAATEGYLTPSATDLVYLQDTTVSQITGDLTIRAKVRATDVDAAATRAVAAVFEGTTATNAWRLYIATGGLTLSWAETAGAATRTVILATTAQLLAAFTDGVDFYIGAELDVDNGGGQYTVRGLTSSDGVTWTTLGTPVTGTTGVSSVNASTGHLKPGARGTTTGNADQWAGRVYWVEVAAGIGANAAIKARFEPGLASARSSSWVSAEGHTWVRSTNGLTVGSPLLLVLNASSPGLDADYSVTNFTAQAGVACTLAILSYSHNGPTMIQEPDYAGVKFAPLLDKWKTTWPNIPILVTLQNPQVSPRDAGSIEDHARRVRGVARLAASRGLPTINVYSALGANPSLYVMPDGIHPTSAGSLVWYEVARKAVSPAIPPA